MSDTTETDAILGQPEYCVIKHARKLERERDHFKNLVGLATAYVFEDGTRKGIREVVTERDKAQEMLADWENAAAHVEAEHADEVHCGCVPVLRKLLTDSRTLCAQMSQEREHNAMQALMWRNVAEGLAKAVSLANEKDGCCDDHCHLCCDRDDKIDAALKAYEEAKK